jgi:hypothetical protein
VGGVHAVLRAAVGDSSVGVLWFGAVAFPQQYDTQVDGCRPLAGFGSAADPGYAV